MGRIGRLAMGDELGTKILDLLGIDYRNLSIVKIDIHIAQGEIPWLTVGGYLQKEHGEQIAKLFAAVDWKEKPEGEASNG